MHSIPKSYATLLLIPVMVLVAGCGKSGSSLSPLSGGTPGSIDQTQVNQTLALHPEALDDGGLWSDPSQTSLPSGSGATSASIATAIRPLFFWRHITHADRSFEFAFSDTDSTGRPTRALVTVLRTLSGDFNIVVGDSGSTAGRCSCSGCVSCCASRPRLRSPSRSPPRTTTTWCCSTPPTAGCTSGTTAMAPTAAAG